MLLFFIILIIGDDFYTEEFMELGMGARALGIGNAFVGLADDITAFYWNTAGLSNIKEKTAFFMYSDNFDAQVKNNTIAIAYPFKNYILCAALNLINVPEMVFIDTTNTDTIIDTVAISDYIGYISFSKSFDNFYFGLTSKIIFRDWFVEKAYGVLFDLGLLYKFDYFNLGANFVNIIGTPIYWTNGISDNIMNLFKYGFSVSHKIYSGKLNICASFCSSIQKRVTQIPFLRTDLYYGIEYWYKDIYAFRIGDDMGSFVCGFGCIYQKLNIDFAIKLHQDLGLVKRLSCHIQF